jgi:predicted PhzF superfamily epimerase YddE/YHI9
MQSWIFQLDAFASRHFAGNAAVVMLLDTYPADSVLQALAGENNQAESVFVVPNAQDYCIRGFTPAIEVPLCGHATLASAAVILERLQPGRLTVLFHSASSPLSVRRSGSAYVMDFPARRCAPARPPDGLAAAPQSPLLETMWDGFNFLVRLESPDAVRADAGPGGNRAQALRGHHRDRGR